MGKQNTLHSVHVQRNDTAENWTRVNPILQKGEMGVESDTRKFKFGDGVKHWQELDYADKTLDDAIKAEASRATGRENAIEAAYKAADTAEQSRAEAQEAAIRGELQAGDTETLKQGKAYTDARETQIRKDYVAADTGALTAAKDYTDTRETAIRSDMTSGDAKTLADAKKHAETKIAELVGSAPEALNTLEEIAAKLKEDEGATEAMLQQIGEKADTTYVNDELAKKVNKAGDTMTGPLVINPGSAADFNEGIRISLSSYNWSTIAFGSEGASGVPTNGWIVSRNPMNKFIISPAGCEDTTGLTLNKDGDALWRNNKLWHAGNFDPNSKADAGHTHTFTSLTSRPTTLDDYGITDAVKNTMAVKATKLEAGQEPTIEYDKTENILTVGIPKGDKGDPGQNATTTEVATTAKNGLMSSTDKQKLDDIAEGANAYVHPSTHPASMIEEDETHKFVTAGEKITWNAKAAYDLSNVSLGKSFSTNGYYQAPDGLMFQWGTFNGVANSTGATVYFPRTFAFAPFSCVITPKNGADKTIVMGRVYSMTVSYFKATTVWATTRSDWGAEVYYWFAIGRWK